MHGFANRPPGTLWVPAFVVVAEGFSPAAAAWRSMRAAGLKPSAGRTKPFGLEMRRAKVCITPGGGKSVCVRHEACYTQVGGKALTPDPSPVATGEGSREAMAFDE
jgi:hypothetical protein